MKESDFFESQTNSSRVKASIVSEYFPSYCKIIIKKHTPKAIRYIDLFAGPGLYKDGSVSTPILIGRQCNNDPLLKQKVKMIFNDNEYHKELKENFNAEFPAGTFANPPHFGHSTVGENGQITSFLMTSTHEGDHNESPSLLFIDPFGYKGIQTKVLAEFLKNWGNEIFIFLNTKRIHPALENDKFDDLMKDVFPGTLDQLRVDRRYKSTVLDRLNLIVDSLGKEYEKITGSKIFYTAFKFQEEDSDATSHFILHLTKGKRGFDLIKTIYNDFANVGTIFDGKNTYTFDAKILGREENGLFDLKSQNIDVLKEELYKTYSGKKITAFQLYEEHHIGGLYGRSHYTSALRRLVSEGRLTAVFNDNKAHQVSVLLIPQCSLKFK
ncbi:MAG: three-Cys-motif partner protein TcmP [Chitinophagaceae bacterium]